MPTLPGPRGPIRYERDAWGYPQVWVRDIAEGAYARGYLHATDRLIQVHISLMAGQGRMMEMLGDVPVARMLDRAIRALDLVSDLDSQVEVLDAPTRQLLEVYCRGFNAALDRRSHPLILRGLGIPPLRLRPRHILLMYRFVSYFGLTSMHHLSEGVIAELVAEKAPTEALEILLGDAIAGLDREALQGIHFPESYAFLRPPPQTGGSNAFAVHHSRSASGGALLMGEFHMEVGRLPPVLYAVHCQYASGDYYSGVGIPGLAWLSAGRNLHIAWTYTFGHADNIDILVERCKAGQYLADGVWHPLQRRVEVVMIKGKPSEQWVFHDNAYGTVLGDAQREGTYPCVRWSGLRGCSAGDINAVRAAMDTQDVASFSATHRQIRMLSLAAVIADHKGNIGYIQTGQIDQRPDGWAGAVPRAAWDLAERNPPPLPESARPIAFNPPSGVIVSANEQTNGPKGERWCTMPEPSYRFDRITALLQAQDIHDLESLVRISYDEVDLCARRMMPIWRPHLPEQPSVHELADWAKTQQSPFQDKERRLLGLFHALHHELVLRLLSRHIGKERAERFLGALGLQIYFQHHIDEVLALERPHLLDREKLASLLQEAWPAALERSQNKDWHVPPEAPFHNALLQDQVPGWLGFSSPSMRLPGGPVSPFQARIVELQGQLMVAGPVFHVLFDMSQPYGWYNIAGGASESRFGPGYGKGLEAWQTGRFAPLGQPQGTAPQLRRD